MVGEIRDGETAKISVEAALTGHRALHLHTNDAPQALTRLNEMGVEPFLVGAAVSAVLAQRLARKLCSHCCEMYTPSVDELLKRVSPDVAAASDGMVFYRKKGCRVQPDRLQGPDRVYQLLAMTEQLESLAVTKASARRSSAPRSARDADALGRRAREGGRRPHLDRRARARLHPHLEDLAPRPSKALRCERVCGGSAVSRSAYGVPQL